MTDDELIAWFQSSLGGDKDWSEFEDKLSRLIALARIGAAVQPRPISEAPKDDLCLYWIKWAPDIKTDSPNHSELGWHEYRRRCWSSVFQATAFIPLSALPQVNP